MSDYTFLAHHGTKGMKWGVRKYQNPDGSLTTLGRIHYGVGSARENIRKKVAPTNAELNAQIRKQRSKNLNKQKKQQLKNLKKGIDTDTSAGSSKEKVRGQHKRFSEMSDQEIIDRINRLKNEVTLAELERTKSLSPGMRMVDQILRDVGKESAKKLLTSAITTAGEKAIKESLGSTRTEKKTKKNNQEKDLYESQIKKEKAKVAADSSTASKKTQKNNEAKDRYESELRKKKAKDALSKWDEQHPTGVRKVVSKIKNKK